MPIYVKMGISNGLVRERPVTGEYYSTVYVGTEFDESLWAGLVDSMTVHSKDRIVFRLTCDAELVL